MRALVTGASSGLGREFAKQLAAQGWDLLLVARREDRLQELATELHTTYGRDARVLSLDLSSETSPAALESWFNQSDLWPDLVVNNAGFGIAQDVVQTDRVQVDQMLRLNILALTQLTALCLPVMLERQRGGFIQVASTAAFQPGPGMAAYFASKAYVHSWSLALRAELRGTGLKVCSLCPGPTSTEFGQVAGAKVADSLSVFSPSAQQVVAQALRAWSQDRAFVVPGRVNRITALLARLCPQSWSVWVANRLFRSAVQKA